MERTPARLLAAAEAELVRVRRERPLVQCLTNVVTTNLVANVLLAAGASPAMVDIPGEAGLFVAAADSVLVNLGTPSPDQREAMREAVAEAASSATPWVLDPVAVGELPVRTALAHDLLAFRPTVIRGNASEIRALARSGPGGRGVDTTDSVDSVAADALELARSTGAVVSVSGAVDLVTDGDEVVRIENGSPLMARMTGAGCALGGIIAAYAAASRSPLEAVVAASAAYEVAAQIAAERSRGPGSFAACLVDELSLLEPETLREEARLS